MKKYSHSQLGTFKNCKAKYKIMYIDQKKNTRDGIEAFMGKRVHDTLEWVYHKKMGTFHQLCPPGPMQDKVLFAEIEEFYDNNWSSNWHDEIYIVREDMQTDEYYNLGKHCLANYYYKYGPKFNQDVYSIELMTNFNINDFKFRGIIDRLDYIGDGSWIIHDYKTGKNALTNAGAKKDMQLALYQIALMQNASELPKQIELKWHFLQQGIERSVIHTEESLQKIKDIVINLTNNLVDSKTFEPNETMLCNWCHYWEDCPVKLKKNPIRKA